MTTTVSNPSPIQTTQQINIQTSVQVTTRLVIQPTDINQPSSAVTGVTTNNVNTAHTGNTTPISNPIVTTFQINSLTQVNGMASPYATTSGSNNTLGDQSNSSLPFDLKLGIILGISAIAIAALGIFIFRKMYLRSSDKFQNRLGGTTFGTLHQDSFHPFVKRSAVQYESSSLDTTPNASVVRPSSDLLYDNSWRGYYEPELVAEGQLSHDVDLVHPSHHAITTRIDSFGKYN